MTLYSRTYISNHFEYEYYFLPHLDSHTMMSEIQIENAELSHGMVVEAQSFLAFYSI